MNFVKLRRIDRRILKIVRRLHNCHVRLADVTPKTDPTTWFKVNLLLGNDTNAESQCVHRQVGPALFS